MVCKGEGAKAKPNSQDPAGRRRGGRRRAGQGSSALCNILGSFEAAHEIPAAWPRPRPLLANRSASGRASSPETRRGEGRRGCYTRRPGLCQRGEPARLPPPPASELGPGGRPRLEELAPQPGQQQVGSSASGLWPLPNCSLALGSFLPFSEPPTPLFLSSATAGLCWLLQGPARRRCQGEMFAAAGGRVAFHPERVPRAPHLSMPPESAAEPARWAEEPSIKWGQGPGSPQIPQDLDARKCCNCIAAGLLLSHCSPVTYKAPRLLRRVNGAFPLALSSLNLVLHRRLTRSADLKSEQLDSNEFSGTATPTDTRALPSHQRLPALIPSNQARACRPCKKPMSSSMFTGSASWNFAD